MPQPRLRIDQTALIVIDLQERLMPTIVDREQVISNAAILLRMADLLEIPYLVTEQYPAGLGRTVEPVAAAMPDRSQRVEKTRFSALVDVVDERLRSWRRGTCLICGVE
ncbi:MAG: isochorismatase family protein, partial [Planctomycetota bacterium]